MTSTSLSAMACKPFYLFIIFLAAFGTSNTATAQSAELLSQHGGWEAYTFTDNGSKVCYMTGVPSADKGDYDNRGDIAAFVTHWPARNSRDVFSYVAGYTYKEGSQVTVTIGSNKFLLFTQNDMAWAPDPATDTRLVEALKSGSSMTVTGTSSRGTRTTDTYQLNGTTAAYNAISKSCT